MPTIRLTKVFTFEMAHALYNYNGACRNIHGHSYKLHITVAGKPLQKTGNPKDGMVMDFVELKEIVNQEVIQIFDHALVLNQNAGYSINSIEQGFDKVIITSYQPTCENLLADFAEKIGKKLPAGIQLFSLRLFETDSSYAEWLEVDNRNK